MFESMIPISRDPEGAELDADLLIGNAAASPLRRGGALRALEWNEVTARLNAARDLRQLMRRDSRFNIEAGAASFGDAAASYFQSIEAHEPDVNLDGLGQGKASTGIADHGIGNAETGDAREY